MVDKKRVMICLVEFLVLRGVAALKTECYSGFFQPSKATIGMQFGMTV